MRILGLDLGDRRIGVAISDALGLTAQRLTVVVRRSTAEDLEALAALATTHHVEMIIVGLPLTLAGAHGPQAKKVVAFTQLLQQSVSVPLRFVDERLTTVQGQRALTETGLSQRKQRAVIDQVAAQLILQHFLDGQRQR